MNEKHKRMIKQILETSNDASKDIYNYAMNSMPNTTDDIKDIAIVMPLVMSLIRLKRSQEQIYKAFEDSYLLAIMHMQR